MLKKKVPGFSEAVADRCATMSRTVQPGHSDGVSHWVGVRSASSPASALRSAEMVAQMSDMANSLVLVRATEVVAAPLHEGIDPAGADSVQRVEGDGHPRRDPDRPGPCGG